MYTVHSGQRPFLREIIWKLLIFGFLILTIYVTYLIIASFFTYPYTTQLEVESGNQANFPAVTICNQNLVRCQEVSKTSDSPGMILFTVDNHFCKTFGSAVF